MLSQVTWYPRSRQDLGEGNGGGGGILDMGGGRSSLLNVSSIVVVKPMAS